MNQNTRQDILSRYKSGNITTAEKALVEEWLLYGKDFEFDLTEEELLEDLIAMRSRINLAPKPHSIQKIWPKLAVAASVLLVCSIAFFMYRKDTVENPQSASLSSISDDKPAGTNVATLTLSDGTKVDLTPVELQTRVDAGVQISNDTLGNLIYKVKDGNPVAASNAFNTISTPRGGTYKILLPDGSKVWLNASSSLRFPLKFPASGRHVELTGEGYFEVARSAKKFQVLTNHTIVEVLGTHFNIKAYQNEPLYSVTLVEGSVKVVKGSSGTILKPGEQAEFQESTDQIDVKRNVDLESLVAWKDGTFKFNNTDLKDIMRQLERWYDVDVDEKLIPDKKFNGTISRDVKLSEVLSMIEVTSNLSFKIEGRSVSMK